MFTFSKAGNPSYSFFTAEVRGKHILLGKINIQGVLILSASFPSAVNTYTSYLWFPILPLAMINYYPGQHTMNSPDFKSLQCLTHKPKKSIPIQAFLFFFACQVFVNPQVSFFSPSPWKAARKGHY